MSSKLPLVLAVGLCGYLSSAQAQLVEYRYTGRHLDIVDPADDIQRIKIDFTIDDSLISLSGHFNESIYYQFGPEPNEASPFQSFLISYRYAEIPDTYLPYDSYADGGFQKLNVIFDTDQQGNISNWNITSEIFFTRHGATYDIRIESILMAVQFPSRIYMYIIMRLGPMTNLLRMANLLQKRGKAIRFQAPGLER
jgi:hypothetical protein